MENTKTKEKNLKFVDQLKVGKKKQKKTSCNEILRRFSKKKTKKKVQVVTEKRLIHRPENHKTEFIS